MKLKTVTIEGKTYAEVSAEGNPIYVHTDGKEVPFDAAHAVEKIDQLNGEAKGHRVEKEKAELALKAFDGLDAESARTAMTTVKGYEAKQLIDAGEAERVRTEAIESVKQTYETQLGQITQDRDTYQQQLHGELIGGGFARSKFASEKLAVPADEDPSEQGYLVEYTDGGKPNDERHKGYISWSPRDVFEKSYHQSQTPQDRVRLEQRELNTKLDALENFLDKGQPAFIDDEQWALLQEQQKHMDAYNDVLAKRIALF